MALCSVRWPVPTRAGTGRVACGSLGVLSAAASDGGGLNVGQGGGGPASGARTAGRPEAWCCVTERPCSAPSCPVAWWGCPSGAPPPLPQEATPMGPVRWAECPQRRAGLPCTSEEAPRAGVSAGSSQGSPGAWGPCGYSPGPGTLPALHASAHLSELCMWLGTGVCQVGSAEGSHTTQGPGGDSQGPVPLECAEPGP